ncbi:MAG: helix-turn-helix domain-containing protein [Gemmatimonadota bacterium]
MGSGEPVRHLGFGRFLGRVVLATDASGVAVRELAVRPTHREARRHTHHHAHFCLVVSGAYEATAGGSRHELRNGALLFHPAGTTHRDHFVSARGCCLTISIGPEFIEGSASSRLPERSYALEDDELGFPANRIRRELRAPDSFSDVALQGLALELIGSALARGERPDSRPPAWLDKAIAFLRESAVEPVKVRDVAAEVGVHPVHLARVFRHHLGLSPGEYLRRSRVREAMELVERTSEPLATIAFRSGFSDQSHLTRAFRRELGTTPAEYRRAVRR